VIILGQWGNILSRRAGEESVWSMFMFANKQLVIAYAVSAFCFLNLIYNPWINHIFGFAPLNIMQVGICIGFGLIYTVVKERYKKIN
jgi:magnesium-transporting ATPase (P-type)